MEKAKHAHGLSENVDSAIQAGKINSYDVLFLDADTGKPKIGWVSKDGKKNIINENLDADLDALAEAIAKKTTMEEVDTKLDAAVLDVIGIANQYTDSQIEEKIAEVNGSIEIVEF